MAAPGCFSKPCLLPLLFVVLGVSKVVTVDVKGNRQRWLKVRDLTKGVTYFFRVQARTITYGPELQANVTAGPAVGKWTSAVTRLRAVATAASHLTLHRFVYTLSKVVLA